MEGHSLRVLASEIEGRHEPAAPWVGLRVQWIDRKRLVATKYVKPGTEYIRLTPDRTRPLRWWEKLFTEY